MISRFGLAARVTSCMTCLLCMAVLVTNGGLASEPFESEESHYWQIYNSSSRGCGDGGSSLFLSLVGGAITASAGNYPRGVVRFAREASTLVFVLGENGCRYGVAVSLRGRISFARLRSLTDSGAFAALGADRLELSSGIAGVRCTISAALFILRSGGLSLQIRAIASQREQVRVGEPQVISDGNVSVTLNEPPCSIDITGTKLD